jgi:hypothetical protein
VAADDIGQIEISVFVQMFDITDGVPVAVVRADAVLAGTAR